MQNLGGDSAQSPDALPGASADMTRHQPAEATRRARTRAEPSFTPLAASDQPSAWSRTALYGGGTALMGLLLALGYATLRPTPRRRPPEVPAPALARVRQRR